MPYPLLVSYLDELADRPDDHDDSPPDGSRYQSLKHEAVRDSTRALQQRIRSRFPDRGLWEVCGELAALVDEHDPDILCLQECDVPELPDRIGGLVRLR